MKSSSEEGVAEREDEYDMLLREQNEFWAEAKARPAAKVIQISRTLNSKEKEEQSKFRQRRREQTDSKNQINVELQQMNIDDTGQMQVVGDIIERNIDENDLDTQRHLIINKSSHLYVDVPDNGFPIPKHRTRNQGFEMSGQKPKSARPNTASIPMQSQTNIAGESRKEFSQINSNRIAKMSLDEISMAQNEIMEVLGPNLVLKIRENLKANEQMQMTSRKEYALEPVLEVKFSANHDETEISYRPPKLVMTKKEALKLKWTEPVDIEPSFVQEGCSTQREPNTLLNLRFDTTGRCLSHQQVKELSNDVDLYHHGKEPSLPGYTLIEIVDYWLVSINSRQRLMALRIIEAIFRHGLLLDEDRMQQPNHLSICCFHDEAKCLMTSPKSGFGFGRKMWDRLIFETLELHWKVFLSLRSSNVNVRSAAVSTLASLLGPSLVPYPYNYTLAENFSFVQFVECLQLPISSRPSLLLWPSAYRRAFMDERIDLICEFVSNLESKNRLDLDESVQRFYAWFSDRSDGDGNNSQPTPVLSQFDPILHILFSGIDLRSSKQPLYTAEGILNNNIATNMTTCRNEERLFWPSEIVTMMSGAFLNFFGQPVIEINCLNLLTALCCHSKEICLYCILRHSELMQRFEALTLSLTSGTQFHKKRQLMQSRSICNSNEIVKYELSVKAALLRFVLTVGSVAGAKASEMFFEWEDGMVLVVLLRQCLMAEWRSKKDAKRNDEQENDEALYQPSKDLIDLSEVISSNSSTKNVEAMEEFQMNKLTANTKAIWLSYSIADCCRCEALKVLTLWSRQGICTEDLGGLFATFLEWVHDTLNRDFKNINSEFNPQPLLIDHTCVLNCLLPYLWSSLLHNEHPDFTVVGLFDPLLSIVELVLPSIASPFNPSSAESSVAKRFHHFIIQFIIEIVNFLTVTVVTLSDAWSQRQNIQGKESPDQSGLQQLQYYSALAEKTISRYGELLPKLMDNIINEIHVHFSDSTQLSNIFINRGMETGLFGQYVQLPTYLNIGYDRLLAPSLYIRLLNGIMNFELTFHSYVASIIPSKHPQRLLTLLSNGLQGSQLEVASQLIVRFSFHLTKRIKCLSYHQGDLNVCGSSSVSRSCPVTVFLSDFIRLLNQLTKQRLLLNNSSESCRNDEKEGAYIPILNEISTTFPMLLAELLTSTTPEQAEIGLRKLLTIWETAANENMQGDKDVQIKRKNLINLVVSLSVGLSRSLHTSNSNNNQKTEAELLWLSSNPIDIFLHIPIILLTMSTSLSGDLLDYIVMLLKTEASDLHLLDHWMVFPNQLPSISMIGELLLIYVPAIQVLEIMCRCIWFSASSPRINSILTPLYRICISNLEHELLHIVECSSSIKLKLSQSLEKTLISFKEMNNISDAIAQVVWLYASPKMPLECRRILWSDHVVLQILNRSLSSSTFIITDPDPSLFTLQKNFLQSIHGTCFLGNAVARSAQLSVQDS